MYSTRYWKIVTKSYQPPLQETKVRIFFHLSKWFKHYYNITRVASISSTKKGKRYISVNISSLHQHFYSDTLICLLFYYSHIANITWSSIQILPFLAKTPLNKQNRQSNYLSYIMKGIYLHYHILAYSISNELSSKYFLT